MIRWLWHLLTTDVALATGSIDDSDGLDSPTKPAYWHIVQRRLQYIEVYTPG